ncbi:hypothetical protein SAMN05444266_10542 [Chitinophaga jiangningensis]|uniref:Uncharacterized protein n=1 Tax=Chitinophaga jiangningensis TaxID=1419482 RepID=A0A1M7DLP6_9BACT|nr:hypothetical protein SAMN05444266_10542 [Chitinophaga jiangningensis]
MEFYKNSFGSLPKEGDPNLGVTDLMGHINY